MEKISKAEYKRRMVLGARFECIQHKIPKYIGTIRTIVKVQTNAVWFILDTETERSWSPFDSLAEVRSDGRDIVIYYKNDGDDPRMTLRPVS